MTIVTRTLTARLADINATAHDDGIARLKLRLDIPAGDPVPVTVDTPETMITGEQETGFTGGIATLDVIPNSRLTPSDTRYVAQLTANTGQTVWRIVMPDRDADFADLIPRPVQGRALRLSTGGVLLLNDGSRLLL